MRHPLRDTLNGKVQELCEAFYWMGVRDGVIGTILVGVIIALIILWIRGKK